MHKFVESKPAGSKTFDKDGRHLTNHQPPQSTTTKRTAVVQPNNNNQTKANDASAPVCVGWLVGSFGRLSLVPLFVCSCVRVYNFTIGMDGVLRRWCCRCSTVASTRQTIDTSNGPVFQWRRVRVFYTASTHKPSIHPHAHTHSLMDTTTACIPLDGSTPNIKRARAREDRRTSN